MLHQLQSGEYARIVTIENIEKLKTLLATKGIIEGCIIRLISTFDPLIFESDMRIFALGHSLAEKIRVIPI
jgi:Fe2+ transport system protein FeoA